MTMATYRVRDVRKPFGGLQPGVEVELTEAEAAGVADKVEAVVRDVAEDMPPVLEDVGKRRKTGKAETE